MKKTVWNIGTLIAALFFGLNFSVSTAFAGPAPVQTPSTGVSTPVVKVEENKDHKDHKDHKDKKKDHKDKKDGKDVKPTSTDFLATDSPLSISENKDHKDHKDHKDKKKDHKDKKDGKDVKKP